MANDLREVEKKLGAISGTLIQVEDDMGKVRDSSQSMAKAIDYMMRTSLTELTKEVGKQTQMFNGLIHNLNKMTPAVQQTSQAQTIYNKSITQSSSSILSLTKAQEVLDIQVNKQGDGFVRNGLKVNQYGEALNNAGEKVNNFNKRTALMQSLARETNKAGQKNIGFLKGYSKYTELGGNSMEYFAEFLTSSREELTIFGMEAAKARKVLYGFAPPGTFRILNKFSSVLQFVGGTYRKMGDDGKNARQEIKKLQEAMQVAETAGSTKEVEAYAKSIKGLEDSMNPSILSTFFGSLMKITQIPMPKGNLFDFAMGKGPEGRMDFFNRVSGKTGKAKKLQGVKDRGEALMGAGNYAATGQNLMFGKGAKESKESFGRLKTYRDATGAYIEGIIEQMKLVEDGTQQFGKFDTGNVDTFGNPVVTQLDADQMEEELKKHLDGQKEMEDTMLANHPWYRRSQKVQKFFLGLGPLLKSFLSFTIKMIFGFMVLALGLIAIIKVIGPMFKAAFTGLRAFLEPMLNFMYEGLNEIWEGAKDLWAAVFEGGSFDDAFNSVMRITVGLFQTVIGLFPVVVVLVGVVLAKLAYAIYKRAKDFFFNPTISLGKKVFIFLAFATVWMLLFWAKMTLFPAILVGLMIYSLGKLLGFYQVGGVVNKPLQVVGENGPEIATLPTGTRVYSNSDSKNLVSNGGGTVNNFNITVNAKDTSDKEMRRIASQIGKMINREVNRGTSAS